MAIDSGIDFAKTFGNNKPAAGSSNKQDLPKAEFWLNLGYTADGIVEGEETPRFVSLPIGIPLDTQELLPTNSRNKVWGAFNAARNDLHEQLMAVAKQLEPGQERLVNLQIQLRRVNEEAPDASAENNEFVKQLAL